MVKIEENKHSTENKIIEELPLPSKAYLYLSQHTGKPSEPVVKTGDVVLVGQKIADAQGLISAVLHASVSGKILAIQDWPHPVLGKSKAIVIESDGKDSFVLSVDPYKQEEIPSLAPEQLREIIRQAGIVGLGGAAFPTHVKLNPPRPVTDLIINCAECEPYLTCDYRLMIEKTDEILRGVELLVKCLGVKNVYIAIEDNKPEAVKYFKEAIIKAGGSGRENVKYSMPVLKSYYPQGGEKQLIKNILNKEVPSGKLPFDVGVVVHNVATVFAVYNAVYKYKSLYERIVTVTGSCLASPKNLLVRIGTPIKNLIDYCAPLKKDPAKIVIGGPMMGIAQYTQDVAVTKSTSGVILLNKKEARLAKEEFCIRCGECVRQCPAGLMPCMISLAVTNKDWELAKVYGVLECIECGLCSFVCPSKRDMVQHMKYAKLMSKR
ncbi:MAG: electron transport complex subunit RsxC [Candidatus Omnitrophota bacterium]|nr:MAG: electron transport complex subunit RsxC [Candidatus Omnitrophota bacterium]